MPRDRDPTTALVLSGGGLRGLAHVGAWRAVTEAGIRPDFIVGVSIGAFVGAAIAGGLSLEELERFATEVEPEDVATVARHSYWFGALKRSAVLRGDVLEEHIRTVLPWYSFYQLRTPLQVGAVNLGTGALDWFGAGPGPRVDSRADVDVVRAVLASSALPNFYPPVRAGDDLYVDGGVRDTFPVRRAAELGADRIVGVDVTTATTSADAEAIVEEGILAISERVFGLMTAQNRRHVLARWEGPPLVHIRPDVAGIDGFSFDHNTYLLEEGYRAGRAALAAAGLARPAASSAAVS